MPINMNRISQEVLAAYFLFHPYLNVRVHNQRVMPESGEALLLPKHQRFLDIPLLSATSGRDVHFMAKKALNVWPFSAYMRSTGAFIVDKANPRESLRTAAQKLADRICVCVFPEGTRVRSNTLGPLQEGVMTILKLYERAKGQDAPACPIVPVGISYSRRDLIRYTDIWYGEPFTVDLSKPRDQVMAEIQAHLQEAQDKAVQMGTEG